MEELKPLLDLLGGESGRIAQIVVWIGAIRIPAKIVSGSIQSAAERAIARVVATEDSEDDILLEKVLKSRTYRIGAFLIDWVFSVKLPLDLGPKAGQDQVPFAKWEEPVTPPKP